ncbi:MAG: hypothetical protein NTX57_23220 [Armatimonadetes bacterium]|nr:hypothetical protein [Armatimonadota bacterium]
MNFNSRVFRMASALTIVGIVASQIPSRSMISQAAVSTTANVYPEQVAGYAAGTYAAVQVVKSPSIIGLGGADQGLKSMTATIASNPDLSEANKIIENSGLGQKLNESDVNVVLPTNAEITKELPASELELLQNSAGASQAQAWVNEHTTEKNIILLSSITVVFTISLPDGNEIELTKDNIKDIFKTLDGTLFTYNVVIK